MEETPQIFYRYEYTTRQRISGYPVYDAHIRLETFHLIKETPAGYWIGFKLSNNKFKWVAKVGKKKYAYPTKEEAFTNLKLRTKRRLKILTSQLKQCESAVAAIENYNINTITEQTLKAGNNV